MRVWRSRSRSRLPVHGVVAFLAGVVCGLVLSGFVVLLEAALSEVSLWR